MPTSGALRPAALFVVCVIIAWALFLVSHPDANTSAIGEHETDVPTMRHFESALFGVSFSYPDTYVLTERDPNGSAERAHHVITLTDRVAAANVPENSEGPTVITVDIFGNSADKLDSLTWIKNTSLSNYKLSTDQRVATTTLAGTEAYMYTWNGLYPGESTVLAHGPDILMLSVTYMEPTDHIRDDFRSLLMSLTLQ
jgi:hypothetical protein